MTPSKPSSSRSSPSTIARRQRRRTLLVERRHQDVRRHDRRDAGRDRRLERHELDASQPIGRMLDERQLEMRVDAGVAVPGKVLAARGDALGLQRPDDRRAEPGDVLGALGQRAIADHRVLRVGVDVEHRRVVERDADGLQLRGQRARESLGQRLVAAARPSVAIGGHSVNGASAARRGRPPGRRSPTAAARGASACDSRDSSATCSGSRRCGRRG